MAVNEFYGLEKLSLVDFEGKIVCTLFTNLCNFRCPYCHNSSLVLNSDELDYVTKEEYLSYLKIRKKVLDAVVISGGEPTLMPDLIDRIKEIKELGYLVKLDTNGSNFNMLKKLVEEHLIDYVAMDIKNSLEFYSQTVGVKLNNSVTNNILQSIDYLKSGVIDYEFRTTLVDELHNEITIEKMGKLIKDAKIIYLQHFIDHGTCIKQGLHAVEKEKALEYKCILEKYVTNVRLRGY